MSRDHMLNSNLDEEHGMLFRTCSLHVHLVGGHLLVHFAQNRDHIHPGTTSQANQEQLHRTKACVLSASMLGCIKRDNMTGTTFSSETHACFQYCSRRHYFCH